MTAVLPWSHNAEVASADQTLISSAEIHKNPIKLVETKFSRECGYQTSHSKLYPHILFFMIINTLFNHGTITNDHY